MPSRLDGVQLPQEYREPVIADPNRPTEMEPGPSPEALREEGKRAQSNVVAANQAVGRYQFETHLTIKSNVMAELRRELEAIERDQRIRVKHLRRKARHTVFALIIRQLQRRVPMHRTMHEPI